MVTITFPNDNTFEFSQDEISFLLDYLRCKLSLGRIPDQRHINSQHSKAVESLLEKRFLFPQNFYKKENNIIINPNLLWRVIDSYPNEFDLQTSEEKLELCFGITNNGDRPSGKYLSSSIFSTLQYSRFIDMTFSKEQKKVFSRFQDANEVQTESFTPNHEYFKQFVLKPLTELNF